VLCDGATFAAGSAAAMNVDIGAPGVYRVEARIDRRLWLLSNPVHLR